MRNALILVWGIWLSGCSGSPEGRAIWNDDSVGIAFELFGPWGQRMCEFSAKREDLTEAQLAGLASLRLASSAQRAGCDVPTYAVTIDGAHGSSSSYQATDIDCSSSPILLFEDFNAWAMSTPCSLQQR